MFTALTNADDIIDLRDVIARFEALETECEDLDTDALAAWEATDEGVEYQQALTLLEDLKGYGGDEQWRGDWYPVILIRESHFTDYCKELLTDIGDLPRDMPGYLVIDWDATADNLKVNYSEVEFEGETYLYR